MSLAKHIDDTGRPVIAGTDIKVSHIAAQYERDGMSADEIIEAHPHLELAAVHAALAHYYDHQDAIRREWAEDRDLAKALRARYGRSKASA